MDGRKIYIFVNSYKPVMGGIQTVTSQLAEKFMEKGYDTTVVTALYPRGLKIYEKIDGVRVWRLPFTMGRTFPERLASLLTRMVLFVMFCIKKPYAVYVHFPLDQSSYVDRLHKIFRFRLAVCFHGHDVLRYDEGESIGSATYAWQKRLISAADVVTSCSGFLGEKVKRVFGIENVTTIYNGVDLSRFDAEHDVPCENKTPYVFTFGRLERIKGFHLLIEAFAKADIPSTWQLVIAGSGTQKEALESLAQTHGVAHRVKLIGRLSPEGIVRYSRQAVINTIPSLREPFGISVIEAMASQRPVIATNAGGIPEIMYHPCGVLAPPTVEGLKDALEKTCRRLENIDTSGVAGHLRNFTIDRMVDAYIECVR